MSQNHIDAPPAGVDVAIPCYQYGPFLRGCVVSVLSQGIRDLRVLIIDNASTDNSLEVAQQLAAEDRRVEVLARRRNLGRHASFNEAIDWASSKYLTVLCADDLLAPGSLARAVSVMERHPDVGFAYGRAVYLGPRDPMPMLDDTPEVAWRIVPGRDLLEGFCRTAASKNDGCATLVRTLTQKQAGYYRAELPYSDDFEMWMRFARLGSAAVTKAIQGIMRVHDSSVTLVARQAQYGEGRDRLTLDLWRDKAAFEVFFAHEGALLPEAARLQRLVERGLAERAYWSALANLLRGRAKTSLDLLKFAVRHRPITALVPPLGYLFWREGAGRRAVATAFEMMQRAGASTRAARASG
jgi:glycosyltransferase involved in cell wall biosynthesis